MDKDNATEANAATIAPQDGGQVSAPQDDTEARYQALETEKENYRKAYLKEVDKNKGARGEILDETDDDKMRRIAAETLASSRVMEITREQDAIIKKTLKENKELKLAHLNKTTTTPPAGIGASTETSPVRDTLVTPEQIAAFKQKGWSDKDIERYKVNLRKRL